MNSPAPASALPSRLALALAAFPRSARALVGVSGGRDSVALLDALLAAGFRRLVVCHLDHRLRGRVSTQDARFVARLAAARDLPLETARADVRALAKAAKCSLETAARDARYAFFAAVAGRRRCRTIFLAHHADDQVETFLFNLLRGSGPAGLAAIAVDSDWQAGRRKLRIVRPLLGVWRAEIDAYLRERGLEWREDATNADPAQATRNALRLEVLPLLERVMRRDVRPALWRAADILGAEEAWLTATALADGPPGAELATSALAGQPVARQRRVLRAWLTGLGVAGVGYEEVERVRALLDVAAGGPAKVNLPGDRHARRRAGKLFVE